MIEIAIFAGIVAAVVAIVVVLILYLLADGVLDDGFTFTDDDFEDGEDRRKC